MRCPACRAELVVVERDRVELDWCPFCRGLWFDSGELEALAKTLGVDFPPLSDASKTGTRACPRCDAAMTIVSVEGPPPLEVDACPREHGLWFDAGELGALAGSSPFGTPGELIAFFGEKLRRKP